MSKYFKGHGEDVMASMRKAHPGYSEKRLRAMFYATANKHKTMRPKRGAILHGEKHG